MLHIYMVKQRDRTERMSIVIIDDNELNLDLTGNIFESEGYTVYTAVTGQEGIELVRRHHPDVVLMDLAMPGMDGIEATQALKQNPETAGIPIIACSALVTMEMREQAYKAGCEGYIAKPVEPRYLIKQVTKHLATQYSEGRKLKYA